jgi:hypothetical protein
MRKLRVKVREIQVVWHEITVPDNFEGHTDPQDYIQEIAEQCTVPNEIVDVQIDEIQDVVELVVN